jgi:hypothetical protein
MERGTTGTSRNRKVDQRLRRALRSANGFAELHSQNALALSRRSLKIAQAIELN